MWPAFAFPVAMTLLFITANYYWYRAGRRDEARRTCQYRLKTQVLSREELKLVVISLRTARIYLNTEDRPNLQGLHVVPETVKRLEQAQRTCERAVLEYDLLDEEQCR